MTLTDSALSVGGDIPGNTSFFNWIKCTSNAGLPNAPTTYGAHLGIERTSYSALELVTDNVGYIDITCPSVDTNARFTYTLAPTAWVGKLHQLSE